MHCNRDGRVLSRPRQIAHFLSLRSRGRSERGPEGPERAEAPAECLGLACPYVKGGWVWSLSEFGPLRAARYLGVQRVHRLPRSALPRDARPKEPVFLSGRGVRAARAGRLRRALGGVRAYSFTVSLEPFAAPARALPRGARSNPNVRFTGRGVRAQRAGRLRRALGGGRADCRRVSRGSFAAPPRALFARLGAFQRRTRRGRAA